MNKQHIKQQKNTETETSLKTSVISRIQKENVQPTGKWVFWCTDCAMWMLWFLTIVAGALAFSEAIYMGMHSGIELYAITHGSLFVFLIESLPYVWLLAFIGMTLLAYYNMRKTKRGYRYSVWQVTLSSIMLTIAGGAILHSAGVSKMVDHMIDASMPTYNTADEWQEYLWAHPEDGRISGVFVAQISDTSEVLFKDAVEREWKVVTQELPREDLALLFSGKRVRLLGQAEDTVRSYNFYGCRVLPWIPEEGHSLASLREGKVDAKEYLLQFEVSTSDNTDVNGESYPPLQCRDIMQQILYKN